MEIVRVPASRATPPGQAINVWQRRRGVIMGAWAFLNGCDDPVRCASSGLRLLPGSAPSSRSTGVACDVLAQHTIHARLPTFTGGLEVRQDFWAIAH